MTKIIKPKNKPVMEGDEVVLYLSANEVNISPIEERARREGYRKQTERHVTIIGNSAGLAIKEALENYPLDKQLQFVDAIKNLILGLNWKFKPKEIYHIEKKGSFAGGGDLFEERESYIRTIEMPAMEKLYEVLNKLLNLDLPTPFPHITLFTRGERQNPNWYGIGINSEEKFKSLNPKKV